MKINEIKDKMENIELDEIEIVSINKRDANTQWGKKTVADIEVRDGDDSIIIQVWETKDIKANKFEVGESYNFKGLYSNINRYDNKLQLTFGKNGRVYKL